MPLAPLNPPSGQAEFKIGFSRRIWRCANQGLDGRWQRLEAQSSLFSSNSQEPKADSFTRSVPMNVQTTRFGVVNLDEKRIITFPAGLLGFSSYKSFALLQPDDEGVFYWLQSLEAPELAFVVTDPAPW